MSGVATAVAVTGAYTANKASKAQRTAADQASALQREQSGIARGDLSPYREFGAAQLGDLGNWLSGPESAFQKPTWEEIQADPGYASRLGAIENSAAARGSLFSGNALRDIGEFGASEYDRNLARRQNELAQRMSLANIGQSAAAGSAGISQGLGNSLAGLTMQSGQAQAQGYGDIGSSIAGGIGAYQGQQQWNDFLNRAYPEK